MAITDLFSRRKKRLSDDYPDIFQYENCPGVLRVQLIHILKEVIGEGENRDSRDAYDFLADTLRKEYGLHALHSMEYRGSTTEVLMFFEEVADTDQCLDLIELSCRVIEFAASNGTLNAKFSADGMKLAKSGIADINQRMREAGFGFEFVDGQLIEIRSQQLHNTAVKPALNLLNQKKYRGAQQEYLSAWEHYKNGKNKEALNDCLKSFESLMKSICDNQGWAYDKNATAKQLIDVLYKNDLIPSYWQNQIAGLRSSLEGAIPPGRNKNSGHGQGSTVKNVPDEMVEYMLHMTASTIVFLAKAEDNIK